MPFIPFTFISTMLIKVVNAIEACSTGCALQLFLGVVDGSTLIVAAKVGNSDKTLSTAWFAAEEEFLFRFASKLFSSRSAYLLAKLREIN